MRRIFVASVVLFIAACGGGVRQEARPEAAQRNAIPTDTESALLIESLTKTYGSDAVDTCLAAWQDARDVHADGAGPVSKPGAGFRTFLSECVGAPAPGGDLRSASGDMRMNRVGSTSDVRIDREPALRSDFAQ